jgi:DNA repair exonuclease SbcCD ATPase subunit
MRLLTLSLRHFAGLAEAVVPFAPGITVVQGPNEAGKSTVRQALLAAFFASPATTARRREEWRPWGSETFGSLAVEFELDGRRFELVKDFERRSMRLREIGTGQEWEGAKVQARLQEALGLSTEPLYRATAMVDQAELASLGKGAGEVSERLSRIVQAGPGDAEAGAVIRRLEREVGELERGLERWAKTPGTIRALEEEVARLEADRAALQRRVAAVAAACEELDRVRVAREAAERDLADLQAALRANQEYVVLEQELAPLRHQEGQLATRIAGAEAGVERLRRIAAELEELQAGGVPDDDRLDALVRAAERVEALRERLVAQQDRLREAERRVADVPAAPQARTALWSGSGLALLGLLLALVAAAGLLPAQWSWPAAAFLAVAGVGTLGWARRREALVGTVRAQALRALAVAREEVETTAGDLTEAETRLQRALTESGSATVAEARARRARLGELLREQAETRGIVETHLGGETLDALRQALVRLRADVEQRERVLRAPEVQARRLTPLQVQRLASDAEALAGRAEELRLRQRELERLLGEGAPNDEELAVVEERLADRRERLLAARRRARVCRAAIDGLRAARAQAMIPARQEVEARAGAYLGVLTRGAYREVRLEEPPLRVLVRVDRAGRWLEPAEPALSRGTVDQVYLAVRLALVEVLSQGRRPPLLLDDPFGSFDPIRLAAAMTLLRRIAEVHQVVLFTCRPEYEAYGDAVVRVGVGALREGAGDDVPAEEGPGPLWTPTGPH